jgi:hypothetical protein
MATNPLTSNDATLVSIVAEPSTDLPIIGMNKDDVRALTNLCRKELVKQLAETMVRQTDAQIWQAFRDYTQNPGLTLPEIGTSATVVVTGEICTYYWLGLPVVRVNPPQYREEGGRLEATQCVEKLFEDPTQRDWATQSLPLA